MELTARQKLTFGRRLEKLHTLLGSIKREQYDHSDFFRKYDPKHPCGTVACALGWAVASKLFRGLGIKPAAFLGHYTITSVNIGTTFEDAANAYFGPTAYSRIFSSWTYTRGYPTVATVRARIRQVAKKVSGYTIEA